MKRDQNELIQVFESIGMDKGLIQTMTDYSIRRDKKKSYKENRG